MKLANASAAALLLMSATAAELSSTKYNNHGGGLRASAHKRESVSSSSSSSQRSLMEESNNFTPLPCNANLTEVDCDGTILLSSIIAAATLEAEALMNATNATSYPQGMEAIIPCGTCAIADLSGGSTLTAPTGIDVQGMLYFPPSSHGILEAAHIFIQGELKIDPPENAEANRVTINLIGPDEDVFLAPHPHNAMACMSYANGECPLGKRPIAVAGGKLDVRGLQDPTTCPSWVNLQDIWNEPLTDTQRVQTTNIVVDGDENGNGDVKCLNGDLCTLEMSLAEPGIQACLRVTTGGTKYDDGYLDVFVNTGDGNGYVEATESGIKYDQNSIVLERCYPGGIVSVQVVNSDSNAWAGRIETSVDGGGSYTPMVCNDCVPFSGSKATLKVGEKAAKCWKSTMGDVLLTNSNPKIRSENNYKILTIGSVDVAEGTITVNLSKKQIGDPFTVKSEPMMAAEVASLNRPVKFTSVKDNSGQHGGHLIIFHTPNVAQMLEGVEVRAFGQTGVLGRYPIHFHHSHNVDGSVIRKNVVRDSEQRCIVVHGTNFVSVENNVAYDTRGHCFIAAEDGYETDNTFKDNLGARTKRGVNLPGLGNDLRCSTYWITSPKNHFIGNVAAGSALTGFWFEEPKQDVVYSFRDNVAHNSIGEGLNLYPHGYSPSSPAYFDNLKLYNNKKGIKMKRTKNIRVRDSFIAGNSVGIEFFKTNGYSIIQNTTFYATTPGHSETICPTYEVGIAFSYASSGRQIRIKDSSFIGFNNPSCDTVGLALNLADIQSSSSSSGTLPRLEDVTFDPPGKNSSFGITPDSFFDSRIIILEDSDGSMTGEQGFFVNNAAVGPFALDVCTSTEGRRPETMFCAGACLHTVSIETRELVGSSTKLRMTSRSDPNKTYEFEGSSSTSDPAYNLKFSLNLTPSDEYDVSFVHAETGEVVYLAATVTLGEAEGSCEVDDQLVESSFIFPSSPDNFDLFPHIDATDFAAESGLVTTDGSLSDFDSADWVTYTGIWFGDAGDTSRMIIHFSALNQGGKIEARLGGVNGDIIGHFYPWNTNGEYSDAAFDIDTDVQGLQQLTFVSSSSSDVMDFTWFELAPKCESTGFICLENSDCCSNTCGSNGFCESSPPSSYFIGYEHRGCSGRNELGTTTKPTVEECAVACSELATCLSFEYQMSTTRCQLSSTCVYCFTEPSSSDWNFYLKVPEGAASHGNPEGNYYLWLLENAAEISPVELVEASAVHLSMASYYIGYHNGGCVGRNELGVTTQTSVEDCASACDAESTCVSFEYKKGSTTRCQLSDSCDHYSLKANDPSSDYTWYLNVPDGYTTHTLQGGSAYLWLINVLAPSNMPSVAHSTSPSASPSIISSYPSASPSIVKGSATYYMGYNTGGCAGMNELGTFSKPVVEECAAACDALSTCVSFEYKRSSTTCQLSSSCDRFDLTLNEDNSSYMWYLKVISEEVALSENPTPFAYLWLLDNLDGRVVTPPAGVASTNYYLGYNTGGCIGMNELGIISKPVVEECAAACDALSACVSFEYKRSSTNCHLSSTCNNFSLTVNDPGNSYMWYGRVSGYTTHVATGGNAYLWLIETPTSSPTKSPVTVQPTRIEPTCLRIITGGARYDDGYLDVFVNAGDGNGYVEITQSGVKHALNSVVVEQCFSGLVGLQVVNSNSNAWAGSIETSVDNGVSYAPMECKDKCTPIGDSTASIVVDGDGNGNRPVKCLNGDTCTLAPAEWESAA